MNKAGALAVVFLIALISGSIAAAQGDVSGIAASAAIMGGCVGYLVGRVDLRKELGLPQA